MKKLTFAFSVVGVAFGAMLLGVGSAGAGDTCVVDANGQKVCGMTQVMAVEVARIDALSAELAATKNLLATQEKINEQRAAETTQTLNELAEVTTQLQKAMMEMKGSLSTDPKISLTDYGDVPAGAEPSDYYTCPTGYYMNCYCDPPALPGFGCRNMVCTCHGSKGPSFPATWVQW